MDFEAIYTFLFETYAGMGVLIAIFLVACIILAVVLEVRTRKTYIDRGEKSDEDDEWALFDDDDDEDE